ncbi:hypothetical protein FEM48_Zijuj11G0166700 [Ziziphus jujuba var. spinosa]|uniref:Protein LURP-one-related 8-like n=1 Tax=Ziziphus jujuba var. spinosa TaxID=714518 RepID=A0A978UK19_ZIZJJ|nr:hypothetical protein FEM48_Zijuj11G0165400 [Ziziphus jujuba var. spinosa]KAH7515161.1 hypothetical protein FEM48_Zijuj11G0166700 [Ziziphus jujuba var. spinosa]
MTKVYPNSGGGSRTTAPQKVMRYSSSADENQQEGAEVLTVWKKSLLFNCTGFTVFNAKGNLVFRVDNYLAEVEPGRQLAGIRGREGGESAVLREKACEHPERKVLGVREQQLRIIVIITGREEGIIMNEPHHLDTATAMSLVILLDQMFGSSSYSTR